MALFSDTRPEAERVLIELLRQAPPHRKLEMVAQMNETVRTVALSGLRQRYPQATPEELRRWKEAQPRSSGLNLMPLPLVGVGA